jgi:hypothetical protein
MPVTYVHAQILKALKSSDGKAKVDFLGRNDGFYEYRAYVEKHESGPYWSPIINSGLYDSFADAESAALKEIPWLRQALGGGSSEKGPL